jgi:hypothetical protein
MLYKSKKTFVLMLIFFLSITVINFSANNLYSQRRPGLSGRGEGPSGPTKSEMKALYDKIREYRRTGLSNNKFRNKNINRMYRIFIKQYNRVRYYLRRRRYRQADALYARLNRDVNIHLKKVSQKQEPTGITKRQIQKLNRRIKRARQLMRKKRAYNFRNNIRNQQKRLNRVKRLTRRNRHKRAKRVYTVALRRINRIIFKLRRRKSRRITNARLSSDPNAKARINYSLYLTKDLNGYRRKFDRIRRRQRADYNFRIRVPRRANIYKGYLRLRARPKNNRNFVIRIKVNGKRVFQGNIKKFQRGRFRYKTINIDENVLKNGKNRVRVVVVKPFNNFYLDIDKLYLRVYARRR